MTNTTLISDDIIREAASLIDASEVADLLNEWDQLDRVRPARAAALSPRSLVIAWYALALEGGPLNLMRVTELLASRLSPTAADLLNIATEENATLTAMYARVGRATHRFLATVDYKPLPTNVRRLSKAEWEETLRWRTDHANDLEVKRQRFLHMANALLGAQYNALPADARSGKASIVLDSTFIAANARGISKLRYEALGDGDKVSAEPDAGYYVRSYERGGRGMTRCYGWEYELATLISPAPRAPRSVPHIVVGFNVHKPGHNTIARARQVCDAITHRGITLDYVVADRAYMPAAKAEVLQEPLRERGASLVMSYSPHDEGRVLEKTRDGVLVEGRWYSPGIPRSLVEANRNYAEQARSLRADVTVSGPVRVARLTELQIARDQKLLARKRFELRPKPRPRGKYEQPLRYGSPTWNTVYTHARRAIEAYNIALTGRTADSARANFGRLKGEVGNAFLVLLQVAATNSRVERKWQMSREV
jgi:hypothetical protein